MPNVEIKGEIENVMVHRSIKEKKKNKWEARGSAYQPSFS